MSEMAPEQHVPDAAVKVAQNLTAIEEMTAALLTQAVHKSNDRDLPGGAAMIALAHVAPTSWWEGTYEAREAFNAAHADDEQRRDTSHIEDEDDTWEPPLQTLLYWSESWRQERDWPLDGRPTIASEANFIRWSLAWAWDNEPHFDNMARDIAAAKTRLENILYAGVRVERGVPCMYDECHGCRLIRFIDDDGERSDWTCRRCRRTWTEDDYWRNVKAANEKAQREEIGADTWCSIDYAAREVGRPSKTIRTWVNDGRVATACIILGKRARFVNLEDVRREDKRATRRNRGVAA